MNKAKSKDKSPEMLDRTYHEEQEKRNGHQ